MLDVAEICAVFGLGVPPAPLTYVARGELGRVSRLPTRTGTWAVKELELFLPTPAEADMNADLQESMLDAGVSLPRPRRTTDGHALFGNIRVYEWLDMAAVGVTDIDADELVAGALARIHLHRRSRTACPTPGTARRRVVSTGGASQRARRTRGGRR